MTLKNRLRRLERDLGEPGCPACRHRRGDTVLVEVVPLPDGTVAAREAYPAPCARCGDIPEQVIEIVLEVVDARPGTVPAKPSEETPPCV